ncbi:hypothetical protein KO317_01240 [Candidatus Micrarchaeota archaeon]|jgi:ribose 1,5-bisphosphate isomerase|nr:hypothetical protein [Candidatus Micrarchaeota archaeon]
MNKKSSKICKDIKSLKIQGAHRVAREGFKAFIIEMTSFKNSNQKTFQKHAKTTAYIITNLRATSPMLDNYLEDALDSINYLIKKKKPIHVIQNYLNIRLEEVLDELKNNRNKLVVFGSDLVENGDIILTHCHSTSVINSLILAKKQGKKFKVYNTESRPKYQGHDTAKELAHIKIDITMSVDSNIGNIIEKVNKIFIGADAVDKNGNLANKIGSKTIAELAKNRKKVSIYSFTELYKYDKRKKIEIEQRDPKEVADPKEFKGVKILNPAFDIIQHSYLNGIVTEIGLLTPKQFVQKAQNKIRLKPSII